MKLGRLTVMLVLVLFSTTGAAQSLSERLQNLRGMASTPEQDFLHPDQAFVMSASVDGPNLINVQWQIADGYYLYHDKFTFEITEGAASVEASSIVVPPGKTKEDPSFGSVAINTGDISIDVPLLRTQDSESPVTLLIGYQGCKDNSLCYPPIKKSVPLILSAVTVANSNVVGDSNVSARSEPVTSATGGPTEISEQDEFTQKLKEGSLLLNILLFFGAGLLLAVTPCVFPMIPILSGIIVGQEKTVTHARGFVLSLVYVVAMALTYAVIGVVAAMAEMNIQAAAQNVWVISIFCLVFVALALSMFGFYEIQMPSALQDRLVRISNSQQGGTLSGVAIMGAVSAIIVGPCVAPPLIGALTYISQTGDKLLGGMALFAMGMGMGVPLLAIGASAGSLLPKAGGWMDTVKKVFGVGLLAIAIWFLARVVSPTVELYLWAALLIISAIYMGALDQLDKNAGWARLWKGIGLLMLAYGLLLMVGASSGSENFYKPLESFASASGNATKSEDKLEFKRIKSAADLDRELDLAAQNGQSTMLDFYADWCIECIRMESNTFTQANVHQALNNVVLLQADVTANDDTDKELLRRFGIYGPPAILFFDRNGDERTAYRMFGYANAEKFTAHVNKAVGSK
jgi:thioredoxin:protein disulfide reductase